MIRSYKDFDVYAKSYELVLKVYKASEPYPQEERYGLAGQMRRAAMSVPLNIAEGHGKLDSAAEFKRYLRMALGSCNEIEVLLELSKDLGYLPQKQSEELAQSYIAVRKMLYRLIERWE